MNVTQRPVTQHITQPVNEPPKSDGQIPNSIYGFTTLLNGSLCSAEYSVRISLDAVRSYIESLDLPESSQNVFRVLEADLDAHQQTIQTIKYSGVFQHISETFPKYIVLPIASMNEINALHFTAEQPEYTLETPFLTGGFVWLPFFTVLRCVITVKGENDITAKFPISNNTYTLETGSYVVFDYNRSVCKIAKSACQTSSEDKPTPFICMNLYYLIYPEWMHPMIAQWGVWIHTKYCAYNRELRINRVDVLYVQLFMVGLYLCGLVYYYRPIR
jgi:hypothetical protein